MKLKNRRLSLIIFPRSNTWKWKGRQILSMNITMVKCLPWLAHQRHRIGLDIDRRITERVLPGKLGQVPIDEGKVERGRIGDEDRFPGKRLEPGDIALHGLARGLEVLPARRPRHRLRQPPRSGLGIRRRVRQRFQVGGECREQFLFRGIGGRSNAEERMLAGDRTVGFDIGADVDFEHGRRPRGIRQYYRRRRGPLYGCGRDLSVFRLDANRRVP